MLPILNDTQYTAITTVFNPIYNSNSETANMHKYTQHLVYILVKIQETSNIIDDS